jgi:phosphoribosylformylglycinamidine synthase
MSDRSVYHAKILINLRKSILDPQGKAVHHALESLGLKDVQDVRVGKYIEMNIESVTPEEARRVTTEACTKLLANPVMEDFSFTLERI